MKIEEKINVIKQEMNKTTPGSLERQTLQKLLEELKKLEEGGVVDVSFVVVAMNQQEAADFLDENDEIFDWTRNPKVNQEQTERFQKLQGEFKKIVSSDEERENWLSHYAERREEWVPHIYPVRRPENTIVEKIERAAITTPQKNTIKFWPDFVATEDDLFAENTNKQIQAWCQVQDKCVLVIDGISLLHPHIRQILLKKAPLRRVAMLILSPIEATIHEIDKLIEEEIEQEMNWPFARFAHFLERSCEFGVNNERSLKRWLFASLPEVATRIQTPGRCPENLYGDQSRGVYQMFDGGG